MELMEINLGQKFTKKLVKQFVCEFCHFSTSRKSHYERHLMTLKHKIKKMEIEKDEKGLHDNTCKCNKYFKTKSGLWKHKQRCTYIEENDQESQESQEESIISTTNHTQLDKNILSLLQDNNSDCDYKAMIFKLIEENSEFKNLLVTQQEQIMDQSRQIGELIPKIGNNNTNNNNIKQRFNINIFLNEQCRDALNMKEFLQELEVTLMHLDVTRKKGTAEGISNVFIENMNRLSVYERPVHCTDTKRETIYIKDNNIWEKDNDKSRIRAAIKDASITQYKSMRKWLKANPDYMQHPTKQDYFIDMVRHCGRNLDDGLDDKIIKRICSNSYVKNIIDDELKLKN